MNEQLNSTAPEPKKMAVWTEGAHVVPKELIIPAKSPDISDDIPTIPDLDDFQDILEKDVSKPLMRVGSENRDTETAEALAEVGGGHSGSVEGVEAALEVLRSYIPKVEMDTADTVWTVDSLLTQLADEMQT